MDFMFFLNAVLLGCGLAMDACAVSMTNGLTEPKMRIGKMTLIAGAFALFQAGMPMLGYLVGASLVSYIGDYIPWIALALLTFLGGKMIFDAIKERRAAKRAVEQPADEAQETAKDATESIKKLTLWGLFVQAVATSIDALSVGVTWAKFSIIQAVVTALIVAIVTFGISMGALAIGKKFGDKLGSSAQFVGGIILIAIGLEICLTGVL